jgi:hypothetical protein
MVIYLPTQTKVPNLISVKKRFTLIPTYCVERPKPIPSSSREADVDVFCPFEDLQGRGAERRGWQGREMVQVSFGGVASYIHHAKRYLCR